MSERHIVVSYTPGLPDSLRVMPPDKFGAAYDATALRNAADLILPPAPTVDPAPSITADRETPDDGHTFRFVFDIRPSGAVVGEPYSDGPTFMGPSHVIEVRAWNLRDALTKAAGLPFAVAMGRQWSEAALDPAPSQDALRAGIAAAFDAMEKALSRYTRRGTTSSPQWPYLALDSARTAALAANKPESEIT